MVTNYLTSCVKVGLDVIMSTGMRGVMIHTIHEIPAVMCYYLLYIRVIEMAG